MAQKFVSLEEAATLLSISKDRLNDLREDGKVRAYRDGTSWKFRADDIDKLATDGIPSPDSSLSDLSLGMEPESDVAAAAAMSDIELDSEIELGAGDEDLLPGPAASDVNLEDLDEPTVPADGASDGDVLELNAGDDADEFSDSILLSETELGESTDRPPSTIIGKAEMAADLDLEMAASDSDAAAKSDVRLAPANSPNVFAPDAHSDAMLETEPPSLSDNFGDLDELEIDLEAESSRILSPEDLTKAKQAAKSKPVAAKKAAEFSDLELAPSDSSLPGTAGVLDSSAGMPGTGLTGLSALELEGDDEDVLGDGSDITLSSESSGINIISPSDSGLALDEVPLELGSSAPIGSSLDLGAASDAEVALEPLEVAEEDKGAEPFALTPFGEEAGEEEEDSSQIIPLDEVSEDEALLGAGPRTTADALGDEFSAIPAGGVMAAVEPVVDVPFSMANIAGLSLCIVLLLFCGMMVFDLMRNMWSWGEVYTLNSSLMDMISGVFG